MILRDVEALVIHSWRGAEDLPELSEAKTTVRALEVAGAGMPTADVKRRSKGWRSKPLATPGWKILESPNAVMRGDVSPDALRAVGVYAEELQVMLRSILGAKLESKFSFRVFNDERDFRRYAASAGAANAESYYDPRTGEAVFWFGRFATPDLFQRAFAHEFVHAYMDRIWNRREPLWFAEGMAEYFSNIDWRGNIFVPGQINKRALLLLSLEGTVPLSQLLRMGREDMYGIYFAQRYAQAWSFVYFLLQRRPDIVTLLLEAPVITESIEVLEPHYQEFVRDFLS